MAKAKQIDPSIPSWLIQNPNDERALKLGYYYNPAKADNVIWFIETLITHRISGFADKPFLLEPWQKQLIHRLYGWRRPNGRRRFTNVWLEIGRGNGKTKLLASLGLYHLIADGVAGAEVYCAAADRGQASILFNEAKTSIEHSEDLSDRCEPLRSEIRFNQNGSIFKTVSADGFRAHGKNPSVAFIDEVHTFRTNEVVEALETGLNKRGQDAEPLLFYATTAGFPNTFYEDMHNHAAGVMAGTIPDLHFLPIIYAVPMAADWTDEKNWVLANPNMGISVSLEKMREDFQKARTSQTAQLSFRRLFLNQILQADSKWIDLKAWDGCENAECGMRNAESKKAQPRAAVSQIKTFGGLDLAEVRDMVSFAVLQDDAETGKTSVQTHYFVPQARLLDAGHRLQAAYQAWALDPKANLHIIPGETIRLAFVREKVLALHQQYRFVEIALDPFQGALLADDLEKAGVKVIKFVQSMGWYTTPCKELEKAIIEKLIVHDGNPILRWNVDNAVLETDAGGRCMPSKKRSNEKIDGLTALVMGYDRVIRNRSQEAQKPTRRGVILIDV